MKSSLCSREKRTEIITEKKGIEHAGSLRKHLEMRKPKEKTYKSDTSKALVKWYKNGNPFVTNVFKRLLVERLSKEAIFVLSLWVRVKGIKEGIEPAGGQ